MELFQIWISIGIFLICWSQKEFTWRLSQKKTSRANYQPQKNMLDPPSPSHEYCDWVRQNSTKTTPFAAAHTYSHVRDYTPRWQRRQDRTSVGRIWFSHRNNLMLSTHLRSHFSSQSPHKCSNIKIQCMMLTLCKPLRKYDFWYQTENAITR